MAAITLEVEGGKFVNLSDCVEVFDASGQLLGTFSPPPRRSVYAGLEVPFSDEEVEQLVDEAKNGPRLSSSEVRAHLKSLEGR